jgi:hypothetical protein
MISILIVFDILVQRNVSKLIDGVIVIQKKLAVNLNL